MVDLEPLAEQEDMDLVRGLIERHREYTGSTVAEGILRQWPDIAGRFVKVCPKDYKRVLLEQLRETREAAAVGAGAGNGGKGNGRKRNGKGNGRAAGKGDGSGVRAAGG